MFAEKKGKYLITIPMLHKKKKHKTHTERKKNRKSSNKLCILTKMYSM